MLGYTNGSIGYLPRAEDYPAGGWKLQESYAVPDLFVQAYGLPVALRPEFEQLAVERATSLIQGFGEPADSILASESAARI